MASENDSLKETVNDKPQDNVENQFGEASSIDKVALNNMIISMRSTVKKSKIRILAKLIRHIKQLKSKINEKTNNMEKNKRKLANLLEEMKIIKALKPDTVSRFVLGNTSTFVELNNKGFQSTEARALARFSDENLLQDRVKKFRAEHSDWKSLAAFVQTQSSGRHIKKKKKNKSNKTKKEETKTNIKAKQIMVTTFLHGKVNNMNSDKEALNSDSDINTSHVTNTKSSQKQKAVISNKNEEPICKDLHLQPKDSEIHSNQEKSDLDLCSETDPQNLDKEIQNSKSHNIPNTKSTVTKLKNSKKELSVGKQEAENSSQNAAKMVVKKINLHNFEDDISIVAAPTMDNSKDKIFGNDDCQSKESECFFFGGQESSVELPEEENKLEKVDQKNDDEPEFTVSGNHSMFLSLSGSDEHSFRGGSGIRGRMNSRSPYSEFRRQKPNSQRHQNPGYQNNFVQGRFSNRGRREKPSTYPLTKTFKESKDNPPKNEPKQRLSDKSNFSDEKLHPSWEASRKRKEQAASISVFQGKKIKFDD